MTTTALIIALAALCSVATAKEKKNVKSHHNLPHGTCFAPGTSSQVVKDAHDAMIESMNLMTGGNFETGVGKWPGSPAVVTYSFATTTYNADEGDNPNSNVVPLDTFMPAGFKEEIVRAFNAWSSIANINFVEVEDNGLDFDAEGAVGDIRIGGHVFDGPRGTLAHGYFPFDGFSASGDIHFDASDVWEIGLDGADDDEFDIFLVAAHEIGHAIGLDHSFVEFSLLAPTYNEDVGFFGGILADDINGAVVLYGPRTTAESSGLKLEFCTLRGRVNGGACFLDAPSAGSLTSGIIRVKLDGFLNYARDQSRDKNCGPSVTLIVDGKLAWKDHSKDFTKTGAVRPSALLDLRDGKHTAELQIRPSGCSQGHLFISDTAIIVTKESDVPAVKLQGQLLVADK